MIYDVESLIDYEKIRESLEKYQNRKIICFGGGTAATTLTKNLLVNYNVECYLDNNCKIWGDKICGKPIVNPEILKEKKKGTYLVIILSKYATKISQQLLEYGLEENRDFINIYNEFSKYFRVKKFDEGAYKFLDFIKRIPKKSFDNIKKISDTKIGVVCIASMLNQETWYPMAQYLILKYLGYDVTLIMDNLQSVDDYIYFEDHSIIAKVYTDYIIERMKEQVGDTRIEYIKANNKMELDEKDIEEAIRLAKLNVTWQSAKTDELPDYTTDERYNLFKGILINNMESIKYFFENNKFDTINVITGLHKHRGLYMWEGFRNNMRVSNYDGAGIGQTLYETNYPCSHSYDITKLIEDNNFTEVEVARILDWSKKDFLKRTNSTVENEGYNYQLVKDVEENQRYYNIIIPLNISWDAAALGLDRVFSSYKEWIIETVSYIVKNTNASIMIREHPAQETFKNYDYENFEEEVNRICSNKNRVYYCHSYEKVNTYKMVEKCKIVLPYSSTIGVEAAIMRKKVIVHSNCYYSEMKFVDRANTKSEYFELISKHLTNDFILDENIKKEAYLCYYFQMKHGIRTIFREAIYTWMDFSVFDLLNHEGVMKIMSIIAKGETGIYLNIKEELDNYNL